MGSCPGSSPSLPDSLIAKFWELNFRHFGGILPPVEVGFSSRLKTTGGQYFRKPSRRIQVSNRYLGMDRAWDEITDTLGHEMVHYWLDFLGKPCGHTPEFQRKLAACGFNRYSRLIPVRARFVYACPRCGLRYPRRRRGAWSCGPCSGRKYDPALKLILLSL